jgi:hypothetical protein
MIAVHVPGRVFLLVPSGGGPENFKFWVDGFRAWRAYLTRVPYDEAAAATAGLMSGNLWKKGVRGVRGKGLGWKQRWFTQIGDSLFYYEQNGVTALGRIDLTDVSWVHFPKPNPRNKFKLFTLRENRVWTLRCDSEAELEVWRAGILQYCQNGPPVDSKVLCGVWVFSTCSFHSKVTQEPPRLVKGEGALHFKWERHSARWQW